MAPPPEKHLHPARVLGFCNGVRRALETVDRELASGHVPLYVLHEIVHNNFVVGNLKKRDVRFVDDPADVPDGATLVLSAHGTAPAVVEAAAARLRVVDATCPLVRRIQQAALGAERAGERIVLFGHRGHPEVEGILGHCSPGKIEVVARSEDIAALAPDDGRPVRVLSQTTLDAEQVTAMTVALAERFADLRPGAGVCYATRDRQNAVRELARKVDAMLVLGSPRSSNSNRLRETAAQTGIPAFLLDSPDDLPLDALKDVRELGLSAGASVPDELVARTAARLERLGFRVSGNISRTASDSTRRGPLPAEDASADSPASGGKRR